MQGERRQAAAAPGPAVPVAVVALFAAVASWLFFGDLRLVVVAVGAAATSEVGLWWQRRRAARGGTRADETGDQGT